MATRSSSSYPRDSYCLTEYRANTVSTTASDQFVGDTLATNELGVHQRARQQRDEQIDVDVGREVATVDRSFDDGRREPPALVGLRTHEPAELGIALGGIHQRQHHVAEATVVRRLRGATETRDQVIAQRTGVGDDRDDNVQACTASTTNTSLLAKWR